VRKTIIATCLALVVAGCASSAKPAATAATATTTVPTTTTGHDTVRQVASVFAQSRAGFPKELGGGACLTAVTDATDDQAFNHNTSGPLSLKVKLALFDCTETLGFSGPSASSLADALSATSPPDEMAALVGDTIAKARALATSATAYKGCMDSATTNESISGCAFYDFGRSVEAFTTVLAGWVPYL
jgi:hypothetical protein